ncbi:hypothetical protein PSEEN4931 [Pseudomonas entomophila L48]|uniref:Uncharacterized protein n=1 Tax=Pseudomonas entomophila (strain L48) TaxID=384676 RepID=Q1I460_PSEE4|nr:hypothetical protein PSEEN4931 [Pseudomonas entomophila L48]
MPVRGCAPAPESLNAGVNSCRSGFSRDAGIAVPGTRFAGDRGLSRSYMNPRRLIVQIFTNLLACPSGLLYNCAPCRAGRRACAFSLGQDRQCHSLLV